MIRNIQRRKVFPHTLHGIGHQIIFILHEGLSVFPLPPYCHALVCAQQPHVSHVYLTCTSHVPHMYVLH